MNQYVFKPMNRSCAQEIAFKWKYEGIYSFYDTTADKEDLALFLDPDTWRHSFIVLNQSEELIGFYSYYFKQDTMWIGFGMKPELTGRGYGSLFVLSGIDFGIRHFKYENDHIMLAVASFNERAIRLYKKIGFETIDYYMQETNGGMYEFIKMRKDLNKVD